MSDDNNDDQGLHPDMGNYVEEARSYNPGDSDDDEDKSLVDKIKEGFVGDDEHTENGDEEN